MHLRADPAAPRPAGLWISTLLSMFTTSLCRPGVMSITVQMIHAFAFCTRPYSEANIGCQNGILLHEPIHILFHNSFGYTATLSCSFLQGTRSQR